MPAPKEIHGQPDDPGVDEVNGYAPVHFEPSGFGRERAMLGHVMIGEVSPQHAGMLRACVRIYLPNAPRSMFGCSSMKAARNKLATVAREWIDAAGLKT